MLGKKGIGEIVAALILISIAIAASIIIYVYSSGLLGSLQGAQPQTGQYSNQIALEFYDWTASGTGDGTLHTLQLTFRNVGSGLAVFAAFYINGNGTAAALKMPGSTCTTITNGNTMTPQSTCKAILAIQPKFKITAGVAYSVRVTTTNGGVFTYSCIAGQNSGTLP
jgi:hypothetical protein